MKTPLGIAEITWDENGFTSIRVLDPPPRHQEISASLPFDAGRQFEEYFAGSLKEFNLPLHPVGTPFQKKVWKALLEIPYGKTIPYLQLAKQLGDPQAIRAIARAIGQNPLWILVPCHRVIGSDGSLVGYGAGIWRKKWLLEHESPHPQHRLF